MTTLFLARHLLPICSAPIENGGLLVEGGRIVAVGSASDLQEKSPNAETVDFGDRVLLPPMANAHTHLELTHFPQWVLSPDAPSEQVSFVDWVLKLIKVRRNLTPPQLDQSLCQGLDLLLRSGTALVGDILTSFESRSLYADSTLHGRVFFEVLGREPAPFAERLERFAKVSQIPPGCNLSWGISPHSPYTLSEETFRLAVAWAQQYGLPASIHLAETEDEVAFVARREGPIAERLYPAVNWQVAPRKRQDPQPRPVRWLLDQGPLPADSLAVHGVHVDEQDVADLARAGLGVVLCPRSNALFGSRRAPLSAYRQAGVVLALGTDSLASSPSLSIWDELAFAWSWFAGELNGAQWLEIATCGGAAVLGKKSEFSGLAPRQPAPFQVVTNPEGWGGESLCDHLCACGDRVRVEALYLASDGVCENVLS